MSEQRKRSAERVPGDQVGALLSKQGLVIATLANDLLRAAPGDSITRIQQYAEKFDVSVGTVQTSLRYLQANGAATLEMHGRLGSYVQTLNYPLLWNLALNQPISGAMPLPYSRRLEGLATGVRQQFEQRALALELRFTRGSSQRLQELVAGNRDWALVSRFAAETAIAEGSMIRIALLLGQGSYMGQRVLLLRAGCDYLADNMRVGLDMQSGDHVHAVKAATQGRTVQLVDIDYSQGLRLLTSGFIDATVWSREDVPDDMRLTIVEDLSLPADPTLAGLNEGAMIVRQDDQPMLNILFVTVDAARLGVVAQEVVSQVRRPAY